MIHIGTADATFLDPVMRIMQAAFAPRYGEAWSSGQVAAMLANPLAWLLFADLNGRHAGFALSRAAAGEAELLLIAVHPEARGQGVGKRLLEETVKLARKKKNEKLLLEVRACNPAIALYRSHGFSKVGERRQYYRGGEGQLFDAETYRLML